MSSIRLSRPIPPSAWLRCEIYRSAMRTAGELLTRAANALRDAGVASPRADAEWLLSHVTRTPRGALAGAEPDAAQRADFERLVELRTERVPLQHLTGTTTFRFNELAVGPGVFIPRPETETVAGWVIEQSQSMIDPVVVDLGTGSGAIAGAVAGESPHARVYAVELDEGAMYWARENLANTNIDLRHGDMAHAFNDLNGCADLVVANPPYIPVGASVQTEVRDHDPELALWSGHDGLDAIRVVEHAGRRLLRECGMIAVEHADVQGDSVPTLFESTGYWQHVQDLRDLAGKPRFVTALRRKAESLTQSPIV